ncbi:hypothetical protein HHL28_09330 [Aerophototrophica crusticola]|uniref:Uncharacterized protein n=1 Tax=Aerophototrophica crusticola TaxID=1709002 RepID=A0A858R7C1_9PROT|nr:hypothetical protein HHL28_09330 [Rhodospirillaceae bacterium B3]
MRRSAVLSLLDRGFTPLLTGRTGAGLASGEDAELCLALVADGWDTWFQPSLRFQHLMTPRRLTEGYLEGLFYELGRSVPLIETYRQVIWQRQGKGLKALWRSPVPRVLAATAKLGKRRLARMGATSPADVLSARISAAFFRGQLRAYGGYWSQGPALRRSIRSWLDNPAQGTDHDPARYETHARAG